METPMQETYERMFPGSENNLFPVFLKLEQLRLLIVGGGAVGAEKLRAVLQNSPATRIRVVASEINEEVRELAAKHPNVLLAERDYDTSDLEGTDLILIAIDDSRLSAVIATEARHAGLLVNVADRPSQCDFYLGSVVQKGALKIGISTNGKSPTVAKRLKEVLQDALPNELDGLLENMSQIRNRLTGDFTSKVERLNAITADLAVNPEAVQQKAVEKRWRRIASWSLFAFFFMFVGHLILSYIPFRELVDTTVTFVSNIDKQFYLLVAAGFLAQLVDGALGMGYGVTSTTVLLSVGVPLPAISGSIHTAEMFSSGVSGYSHYKFGNVNKRLFRVMLIPGILGAIGGALLLSWLGDQYANIIKPILAAYTLLLGLRIIFNAFKKNKQSKKVKRVGWLAVAGGFLDSFGGGGWGPLVTSTLIAKGKTPRYVIGTVSITEFFVTLASALTFFTMIGISHWQVILGLILGGMLGAPIAARLAGKLPLKTMFVVVGGMVIIWSLNIILRVIF